MEAPVAVVAEEQLVVVLRGPAQRASLAFYTEQQKYVPICSLFQVQVRLNAGSGLEKNYAKKVSY